jgi:hypothetical protein
MTYIFNIYFQVEHLQQQPHNLQNDFITAN